MLSSGSRAIVFALLTHAKDTCGTPPWEKRRSSSFRISWKERGAIEQRYYLPPELIVALMHPKGGNLRWIVASGDPHHFELKQDIGKEIKKEIEQSK